MTVNLTYAVQMTTGNSTETRLSFHGGLRLLNSIHEKGRKVVGVFYLLRKILLLMFLISTP